MKSLVLFITMVVCTVAVNAQSTNLLLFESFSDNSRQWAINTTGEAVYTINSGKYVMENTDDKLRWSGLHVKLDDKSDFAISCTTTHNSGVTNSGYGLVFGLKDNDNYFVFDISPGGYYRLYSKTYGTYNYLINWTANSYINKSNYVDNSLKVTRSGSLWYFYINGNWVNSYSAQAFYGDIIGFIKGGNQRIEFDDLEVDGTSSYASTYTSTNNSDSKNSDKSLADYTNGSSFTFSDDFSYARDEWDDDIEEDLLGKRPYTTIDDDVLTLRSYKDSSITRALSVYLDTKATFDITAKFERVTGLTPNASYGISIEDPSNDKAYAFYISANGYAAIKVVESGNRTGDWKECSYVNQADASNKIEIKSDGSYWSLYVNDRYVTLISSKYIYHPTIFLIANDDQEIAVQQFDMSGKILK